MIDRWYIKFHLPLKFCKCVMSLSKFIWAQTCCNYLSNYLFFKRHSVSLGKATARVTLYQKTLGACQGDLDVNVQCATNLWYSIIFSILLYKIFIREKYYPWDQRPISLQWACHSVRALQGSAMFSHGKSWDTSYSYSPHSLWRQLQGISQLVGCFPMF